MNQVFETLYRQQMGTAQSGAEEEEEEQDSEEDTTKPTLKVSVAGRSIGVQWFSGRHIVICLYSVVVSSH